MEQLVPQLGKLLVSTLDTALVKPLQEGIKKTLVQSVVPKLEALAKEKKSPSDLSKDIRAATMEGFSVSFREVVVPALDRMAEEVGRQLSSTVDKGLSYHMEPVLARLSHLEEDLDHTISQLPTTQQGGNSNNDTQRAIHQVESHLERDDMEQAITAALNARNMDVLGWLCSKLDPHIVFTKYPPLPQHVLLSLIQQLGYDLSRETTVRVNWLREALLAVDTRDRATEEHGAGILNRLLDNLESHYPKHSSNPSLANSFKLLMHMANSLLK
jgi:enhancer of mRNA-decapping protein 4